MMRTMNRTMRRTMMRRTMRMGSRTMRRTMRRMMGMWRKREENDENDENDALYEDDNGEDNEWDRGGCSKNNRHSFANAEGCR